jgi:protein-tyrosine phosphatase
MNITDRQESFDLFRFRWHLGEMVAGSAMPGRHGDLVKDLEKLKEEGIALIVNLTCTTLQIPTEYGDSFRVVHVPIVDGHPPGAGQLNQIMDLVRDAMLTGKRTVIHCRGGMGRTASVIIPLLMEFENLSLEKAVEKARKSGRFTQTSEQREFLESYANPEGST